MFKGRSKIPQPPPVTEPDPDPDDVSTLADDVITELAERSAMTAAAVAEAQTGLEPLPELAPTEPAPEPMPEPAPSVPISGLTVGRVVHTLSNHELCAGMVSRVYDVCTGECAVFVFEAVAPPRTDRLTYAGDGAAPAHGTWAWPTRG